MPKKKKYKSKNLESFSEKLEKIELLNEIRKDINTINKRLKRYGKSKVKSPAFLAQQSTLKQLKRKGFAKYDRKNKAWIFSIPRGQMDLEDVRQLREYQESYLLSPTLTDYKKELKEIGRTKYKDKTLWEISLESEELLGKGFSMAFERLKVDFAAQGYGSDFIQSLLISLYDEHGFTKDDKNLNQKLYKLAHDEIFNLRYNHPNEDIEDVWYRRQELLDSGFDLSRF